MVGPLPEDDVLHREAVCQNNGKNRQHKDLFSRVIVFPWVHLWSVRIRCLLSKNYVRNHSKAFWMHFKRLCKVFERAQRRAKRRLKAL